MEAVNKTHAQKKTTVACKDLTIIIFLDSSENVYLGTGVLGSMEFLFIELTPWFLWPSEIVTGRVLSIV